MSSTPEFERKTLILTGASRGIGHATVKRFSSAGWRVITCSRHAFPENCPWAAGPEDHIQVDLSDPEDVKVTAKGGTAPVLLHLGNESFLPRFMVFLSNVQKWEQERGKLESVDLRYGREVILNPDMNAAPPQPSSAAAKAEVPAPSKSVKDRHRRGKKRKGKKRK